MAWRGRWVSSFITRCWTCLSPKIHLQQQSVCPTAHPGRRQRRRKRLYGQTQTGLAGKVIPFPGILLNEMADEQCQALLFSQDDV